MTFPRKNETILRFSIFLAACYFFPMTALANDSQITEWVVDALAQDQRVDNIKVHVAANDGIVTLSGNVGSAYAKQRATDEVKEIAHVKAVNNEMKVDPVLMRGEKATYNWPSEEELEAALTTELNHDSRIDAAAINPSVEYGHVVLDGAVRTLREKRIAEQDAFDIIGVQSVANNLSVNPGRKNAVSVESEVAMELASDTTLHQFDLKTKSIAGTIILSGTVNSLYERSLAERIAARVHWVTKVDNQIVVKQSSPISDDAIKQAIVRRWSQNKITQPCKLLSAEVKDGIATLTGNVDSWAEYQEASRVAFHTQGVRHVKNQLVVEGWDYPWEQLRGEDGQDFDPDSPQVHQFLFN
ncbi:BON domain-containing protein [Planctomycetes bacterium TBK1r]|uniref:Periplasmic protein n=1 Tax=Stieleria magnilauensis TaxID=2527963 RepID=A0ABX5XV88_9BACT|nr:periplasmic protein [Planctomycetes bacterium TBK1r]